MSEVSDMKNEIIALRGRISALELDAYYQRNPGSAPPKLGMPEVFPGDMERIHESIRTKEKTGA